MSRPSLSARLSEAAGSPRKPVVIAADDATSAGAQSASPAPSDRRGPAPSRQNKTMIAGYYSQDLARAVKLLAVEQGVTVQALLGEALDDVFRKYGKHPMGER